MGVSVVGCEKWYGGVEEGECQRCEGCEGVLVFFLG